MQVNDRKIKFKSSTLPYIAAIATAKGQGRNARGSLSLPSCTVERLARTYTQQCHLSTHLMECMHELNRKCHAILRTLYCTLILNLYENTLVRKIINCAENEINTMCFKVGCYGAIFSASCSHMVDMTPYSARHAVTWLL